MKSIIGILLISLCLLSCEKEKTTNYTAHLVNGTTHQIKIQPYVGGAIDDEHVISLLVNAKFEIARSFDRGIVNQGGFTSDYFYAADSIQVIFDNIYTVTHYFKTPSGFASKYYIYTSTRNLLNYLSYAYNFTDESKYKRNSSYTYTFTEQDFLYAKN